MKIIRFSQKGLVGYWRFDEETGSTAKDSSPYGNDGTIYGATRVRGIIGKALSFDGMDDYVEVPDSPELRATTLTVTAWVKLAELGRDHAIAVKRAVGTTNEGWRFLITSNNNPRFMFYDGAKWRSVTFSNLVLDKEWHFVAVVHDENTGTAGYLDDTSEFVSNPYAPQVVTVPVVIGWTKSPPDIWMNGTIDEVRIYNRALSPGEIKIIYAFTKYIKPHPIIMRRKL